MKNDKPKKYPILKDFLKFEETLGRLTTGKKSSTDRRIVRQALRCQKDFPGHEGDYGNLLFRRLTELDSNFFKIVLEEIQFHGRVGEHKPQAAAVVRGHMFLWEQNGEFPTVNELFDYVQANEPACKLWRRFDKLNRIDPDSSDVRVLRDILDRNELETKPDKRGRKRIREEA